MKIKRTKLTAALLAIVVLAGSPAIAADGSSESGAWSGGFDLIEFNHLGAAFNEHQGSVRLVALLSASCGYCIKGYRYMRKLLEEISDPRLKMLVAWEPMLSGDTRELSLKMAKKAEDPRMVYQSWDVGQVTGNVFTALLSGANEGWQAGDRPAWDVYLLYEGDATWTTDRPTLPSYWQHQGAGPMDRVLNYGKLKAEIEARLARLPAAQGTTTRR
jgi:hypothetical protein